eukprot:2819483-Pyramimonas_sp.AAC.2
MSRLFLCIEAYRLVRLRHSQLCQLYLSYFPDASSHFYQGRHIRTICSLYSLRATPSSLRRRGCGLPSMLRGGRTTNGRNISCTFSESAQLHFSFLVSNTPYIRAGLW